jgi:hypothetical protein
MSSDKKTKSIFDSFTRKYALSKTLRFELKPIWNTPEMLKENHIFEIDGIRHKKYEETKPWFDRLHREFIKDSLFEFKFKDLKPYHKAFNEWQKDKKSKVTKEALTKEESKLRDEIVERFNGTAKRWAEKYSELELKKNDIGVLFEASIFKVLEERYKNEPGTMVTVENGKKINIFDDWDGWTGYFKKYFETRKNFYKADDTSTALAYRIVNQNLRRFIQNIQLFKQAKNKIDIVKIEKRLDISCNKVFSLENYNDYLLQDGIDSYNRVIGGYVGENDEKIPGINQVINEYRQKNNGDKIRFLAMLDKQIHSEQEKFLDVIENDKEFVKRLKSFADATDKKLNIFKKLIDDFASNSSKYNLSKIYISAEAFNRNANRWFSDYGSFERALLDTAREYKGAYSALDEKTIHEKEGQVKYPDFLICAHIKTTLDKISSEIFKDKYYDEIHDFKKLSLFEQFLKIIQYEIGQQFSRKDTEGETVGYKKYRDIVREIINSDSSIEKNEKVAIKNFADSVLSIYQIAKYFAVEKKRRWLDYFELDDRFYNAAGIGYMLFYGDVDEFKSAYEEIVKGYNALRNYLTKKPYSEDKWVLNFDIQTFADGWDKNKEKENGVVIFRKDGRYYLGVMDKENMKLFTGEEYKKFANKGYEKMEYKYFPNPSQMIPKCSTQLLDIRKHFSKSTNDYFLKSDAFITPLRITKRVFDLNNFEYRKSYLETLKGKNPDELNRVKADSKKQNQVKLFQKEFLELGKNEKMYKSALRDWIDFCKEFIKTYKSTAVSGFDYSHIKPNVQYDSVDQFYHDVEIGSYKVVFVPISESYLQKKNADGKLFIFKIHNKDWNLKDGKRKSGAKNLHTLYWEHLFNDENAKENFVFKLNGEAELFFRPKTEESKLGYKKWDSKEKEWVKINKKENGAVIDRRRYSENTILFHCPITINRVSENKTSAQMNAEIRRTIADNRGMRIIGIDRGEKHLAYYSVINQNGKIIDDDSLNTVGEADNKSVPYGEILEKRAKKREAARQEWQEIEQIKDTKRGYVSQIVRQIADTAVQYPNAIIVLEDLSMRFKQVRGGIEKSIYQQFEKQLIDKLSFLVNKKETDTSKPGHPLNALQLASPITAFKDMGKQTGIVFYTAAGYTSRTCPVCGFRRNVRFHFENIDKAKTTVKNLNSFIYNSKNDSFTIAYSLSKLLNQEQLKNNKTQNKLYEDMAQKDTFALTTKNATRYKWFQRKSPRLCALDQGKEGGVMEYEGLDKQQTKRGIVKIFDVTAYLKKLLKDAGIVIESEDLHEKIISHKRNKEFYEKLLFALFLLTETRQSISATDVDYIHCPECGFDSRQGFQGKQFNSDANGAYNIARKGIMLFEKMKQYKKKESLEKMGWGDMAISIKEWDKHTQIVAKQQWNPASKYLK